MTFGSVPVLEATLALHSAEHPDWKEMTIGFPLALLPRPTGEHELVLNFSGVRWTLYADGELLDNEFPFGYPQWPTRGSWRMDPEYLKQAALHFPAITPMPEPAPTPRVAGKDHLARPMGVFEAERAHGQV